LVVSGPGSGSADGEQSTGTRDPCRIWTTRAPRWPSRSRVVTVRIGRAACDAEVSWRPLAGTAASGAAARDQRGGRSARDRRRPRPRLPAPRRRRRFPLAEEFPSLSPAGRERKLRAHLAFWRRQRRGVLYTRTRRARAAERALADFWCEPTAAHARAYLSALVPIARAAVDRERALAARPDPPPPLVGERRPVAGRYLPEAVLGGDGVALRARAGWDWPPTLVRVLDAVRPDGADQLVACAVREYGDGTLADLLRARGAARSCLAARRCACSRPAARPAPTLR
jgi:hypothetical protein